MNHLTWLRLIGASIFEAGALIGLAVFIALQYEAFAYATGLVPTISDITVQQVIAHRGVALVAFLAAGILIGALGAHFGDWIP